MDINKKRFPVILNPKQATDIIKKELKKKNYPNKEIKPEELYLTITPYWISFFDILENKNSNFNHIRGQIAINAINNKINEKVISLFEYAKPKVYKELNVPKTDKTKIILKDPIVKQKEAEKSILYYLSHKYNTNTEKISLSGIEEIYVPTWKIKLKNYKLKLDSIKGEINDFDKIKEIPQTKLDLFNEMLNDLKSPEKIKSYFFATFNDLFKGIYWILKQVYKNYKIILWIILIGLLFYLIFL
jgi:hypothetical protein